MITSSYVVTGMTCGHCTAAVTEELTAIAGVINVAIDLATGTVTINSTNELAEADVCAAIDEAGYQLVA